MSQSIVRRLLLPFVLIASGVLPLQSWAAPGDLDTTFGGSGWASPNFDGNNRDYGADVLQQADGKLVAVGSSNSGNYDFALARYKSDGALDTDFDSTGTLTTAVGTMQDDFGHSVIQQADGKLVMVGDSVNGSSDFALVRYNLNGTLDTSLDGDGKLTTAVGVSDDQAHSVIQQADGKLVVAGSSYNGSNYNFAVVRYNNDGSLDLTFDGDGKLTTVIGQASQAYSVLQQTDGKLVVAGYSSSSGGSVTAIALVRYNQDGALDVTFGDGGKLTTIVGDSAYGHSVIQQVDGKLVVAGASYSNVADEFQFALVRYNSDGSLDTTFNGIEGYGLSVIQQADGKLVVAGSSYNGSNDDFALVRFNTDGSPDTTFNGDGKLTLAIGTGDDVADSVIQQADGKLVVAGSSISLNETTSKLVVARFESGQLDTDSDGYVDGLDNCTDDANLDQKDTDGDGIGDACDTNADSDGDGVDDLADNCAAVSNADQLNTDGDTQGDACDTTPNGDTDGDGVDNLSDNCPTVFNADQVDIDADGAGDVCDLFPLDDTLLLEKNGTAKNENLGSSIAMADMNNDGVVDVLVGAPMANVVIDGKVLKKAGVIRIISGKDNSIVRTLSGTAANQQLGTAIAIVDDQNSDAVPDVVVGEPLADITTTVLSKIRKLKNAGRVAVYSGSNGLLLNIIAEGSKAGNHFGAAVAIGDVNNDAQVDLIVGAPLADTEVKNSGQVTVFNGVSNVVLYQRNGDQAGESFGAAVAVDHQRLFIGSPLRDVFKLKNAGRVQIFNAANGDNSISFILDGVAQNDNFGSALSAANGDWAVGIPLADSTGKKAGSVQLFNGLNATPVATVPGGHADDNFGSALNMQGDVNQDGKNDLAIGAAKFDVSTSVEKRKSAGIKTVLLKDAGRVEVLNGATL